MSDMEALPRLLLSAMPPNRPMICGYSRVYPSAVYFWRIADVFRSLLLHFLWNANLRDQEHLPSLFLLHLNKVFFSCFLQIFLCCFSTGHYGFQEPVIPIFYKW